MPSPIVHFQFTSAEPATTAQYLHDVFDWDISGGRPGTAASLDTHAADVVPNDIFVNGSVRSLPAGARPAVTIFVRVADIDATLRKAVEHGGAIVMPRTDNPGAPTIALVRTPDGIVVGVVQL